jgi:hypothetical protein
LLGLDGVEATFHASNGADATWSPLPDGTFEVDGVPVGRCELKISAPGHSPVEMQVEIGADERVDLGDLRLGGLRAVRVRVTDEDGAPLPGTGVFTLPESYERCIPPPRENELGKTDRDGELAAAALGDAPLRLLAWRSGYVPAIAEVLPDEATAERTLILRQGATLRVEGLQQALADTRFWRAYLFREGADVAVRTKGVNNRVSWMDVPDLEPGRYVLEFQPIVVTEVPGWRSEVTLPRGTGAAIMLHLDGRRIDSPLEAR